MARSRQPRDLSRHHLLTYLGIVLFLLADIGLVAYAVASSHSANTVSKAGPIPTFHATAPTAGPTSTPTPPPTAAALAALAVPPTRLLSALNATTAWRATTGACPATAAYPELSTDSGATWKTTDATGPTKVTALQRIIVGSPTSATMIGLSQAGCAPELVKTFVAGSNFAPFPKELASTWYADPSTPTSVHSPLGEKSAPCPVVAIAPRDGKSAAILCANHTVYATTDAAVTWSAPLPVAGASNLAATPQGYLAAAEGDSGCTGVSLVSLSVAPLTVTATDCLALGGAPSPAGVALSEASGTLWVWAGSSLKRSSDGGATWH